MREGARLQGELQNSQCLFQMLTLIMGALLYYDFSSQGKKYLGEYYIYDDK